MLSEYKESSRRLTTPTGGHVEVAQGTQCCPECSSTFDSLDPAIIGEQHTEDGDAFVVIRSSHRSRDVARHNRDETSRQETCLVIGQLICQTIGDNGGERRKERCQENANISNVNRKTDHLENVEDDRRGDHKTWIDCATNNTSKRIPSALIVPIEKVVETFFSQKFGGSIIKIRIKLVDDTFEAQHRKQSDPKC